MKAKSLKVISEFDETKRNAVLSEGLYLIWENVESLIKSMETLSDQSTQRGYCVLRNLAEEEAAKYLIILDYLRLPEKNSTQRSRQLKHFYNHFSRLLYVSYCDIRPATWNEVCRFVEDERPSLYLDGPNDIDWIFRNRLIQKREQAMYVDFTGMDEDYHWIGPAELQLSGFVESKLQSHILKLVESMHRLGFAEVSSLEIIQETWKDLVLQPKTHWKEIEHLNETSIARILKAKEPINEKTTDKLIMWVQDHWYFPLGSLDLNEKKIKEKDLKEIRNSWYPW